MVSDSVVLGRAWDSAFLKGSADYSVSSKTWLCKELDKCKLACCNSWGHKDNWTELKLLRVIEDITNAAESESWRKLYSFWKGQNAKTQSSSEWKSLELKRFMGLAVDTTATRQVISVRESSTRNTGGAVNGSWQWISQSACLLKGPYCVKITFWSTNQYESLFTPVLMFPYAKNEYRE